MVSSSATILFLTDSVHGTVLQSTLIPKMYVIHPKKEQCVVMPNMIDQSIESIIFTCDDYDFILILIFSSFTN